MGAITRHDVQVHGPAHAPAMVHLSAPEETVAAIRAFLDV